MRLSTVILLSLTAAGGCDSCDPAARDPGASPEASREERPPGPAPEGEPSGPPEPVRFLTEDLVTIEGTLHRGPAPSSPAAILVHRLGADRAEMAPVARALTAAPGFTVLAIDLRGHGASTAGPTGLLLSWQSFERADWEATARDVRAAVTFLEGLEGLAPTSVGVVGSSIGASAAIVAAAEDERIGAVVALSPGRAYRGVDAVTPVARFERRVALLAMAAEEEEPAVETARNITRIAPRAVLQLYPGEAHGVELIQAGPGVLDRIRAFLADPPR